MLPLVGGCSGGEVREHTSYLKSQLREVQVFDVQLCSSLCNPMDYSPSGSSVHGILQARILEWIAIPFSRVIFPSQGSNLGLLHCRQILYCLSHEGSPFYVN